MTLNTRTWYQEPMVWLMLGIPLATVVAGLYTLFLASGIESVSVVNESIRKTGQVQVGNIEMDNSADAQGISASVKVDLEKSILQIHLDSKTGVFNSSELQLHFSHPNDPKQDQILTIQLNKEQGFANVTMDFSHHWNLRLRDAQQSWQLFGRLEKDNCCATLVPRIVSTVK